MAEARGIRLRISMKASVEGVNTSGFSRRAVEAYKPTPRPEICVECQRDMTYDTAEWEFPLELVARKHTLVVTNVPVMRCECGEVTHDLDVEVSVDELIDQLAKDALRYQKEVPERMSIEELFREEYLGNK